MATNADIHELYFQRNANTGWGSKEESNARWEHDRHHDPQKKHKNFPSNAAEQRFPNRTKEESRSTDRESPASRSEVQRDQDSRMMHNDRSTQDHDRYRHDKLPKRSRGERQKTMTDMRKEEKKDQKGTSLK